MRPNLRRGWGAFPFNSGKTFYDESSGWCFAAIAS